MNASLHLVQIPVDAGRLHSFARKARLPPRDLDDGYAVHALLAALFDFGADASSKVAPKPFLVGDVSRRTVAVFAYARLDQAELRARAQTFADPAAWGVVDVDAIASRPMPTHFEAGRRIGFTVQVCPVRRVKREGQAKARAEVDIFLARASHVGPEVRGLERESIYREWLAEELAKGGAVLKAAKLTAFQLARLLRRTQGAARVGARVTHPKVTFEGVLEVREPELFGKLLARGLGRHRSFGFGMLLLRPASE